MAKSSRQCDNVTSYNEDFIKSISLANVSDQKELRALLQKLEKANYEITNFYSMLLQDYISSINNNYEFAFVVPDLGTVKKYKNIASKIQKAYNYILYLVTFDNPYAK
jgi:hypothetical protein